jgi:hypothetical protein
MKTAFHVASLALPKLILASFVALALHLPCSGATADSNALSSKSAAESLERIRQPAVAGLFYPKDPKALAKDLDRYLADAPTNVIPGVRALICPHAGYEYSGPIAARAYRQIAGAAFDTVVILAASHYAMFDGVSVPAADAYVTPLGKVPVSSKAREMAKRSPFVLEPKCLLQRPQWAGMASKPIPRDGEETPETWEHSVEVQVPFLQRALKQFEILPVVFGHATPASVAEALAPLVNDRTLVVVSSDLSHYHPYAEARKLDQQTLNWVCETNLTALAQPSAEDRACGRMPILTLLELAKLKGWKPQLLDYRNSGDTAGDKSRVVGYGAVAFVGSAAEQTPAKTSTSAEPQAAFNSADRKFMLELARKTLSQVTAGKPLPVPESDAVPAACRAEKGCFVTLTKAGDLRGCIGNIMPTGPLYLSVAENARSAALRDPRFHPVTADEAPKLHIEISVLSLPEPLAFSSPDDLLAKLQPHRDGVVLRIGERGATFLPQVWEQLPEKTQFLSHLSAKAGCAPDAWRGKDVTVSIYHVEAFQEAK